MSTVICTSRARTRRTRERFDPLYTLLYAVFFYELGLRSVFSGLNCHIGTIFTEIIKSRARIQRYRRFAGNLGQRFRAYSVAFPSRARILFSVSKKRDVLFLRKRALFPRLVPRPSNKYFSSGWTILLYGKSLFIFHSDSSAILFLHTRKCTVLGRV